MLVQIPISKFPGTIRLEDIGRSQMLAPVNRATSQGQMQSDGVSTTACDFTKKVNNIW